MSLMARRAEALKTASAQHPTHALMDYVRRTMQPLVLSADRRWPRARMLVCAIRPGCAYLLRTQRLVPRAETRP